MRTHYSNPEVVRMAVRSRAAYLEQPYYERCGWLFLVDEEGAEPARRNREMQLREGALSDEVDPADFGVATDGVAYALFEPDSGFADPVAATRAFIDAARREGAEAREHVARRGARAGPRRARGRPRCSRRTTSCSRRGRGRRSSPRRSGSTCRSSSRASRTSSSTRAARRRSSTRSRRRSTVSYMRPAGDGRFLAGRGYPKDYELVDPERYDETVDEAFEADVRARVQARLPGLNGLRRVGGKVGLYEVTPDWHPILGPVDGYDGLFLATGGSGHCFKLGPAIGELVAGRRARPRRRRHVLALAVRRGPRARLGVRRQPRVKLVIRNGTVYDGTGAEGRIADVAIDDGRIAGIGQIDADAHEIDADGLAVAPGFIDIHSHSDYTLLMDPRAVSAIHQGVTTEVVGNCGFGCFPIRDPAVARRAIYGYSDELPVTWSSAGEYFEALDGCQAGRERAQPRAERPAAHRDARRRRPPGRRARARGDAGAAARVARRRRLGILDRARVRAGAGCERGGADRARGASAPFYATHTRRRDDGAADAVAEAIRTGDRAGVRLQVSHLVPRNGIEESRRCIELVEAARERGQDVAFDMHTRTFGLTNLYAALPAVGARRRHAGARGDPRATRRSATRCARTARS